MRKRTTRRSKPVDTESKIDLAVPMAILLASVFCVSVSFFVIDSVIKMIPEPEPYEIPWADRIEESDTSLPLTDPGETYLTIDSSQLPPPPPPAPVYEPPPCRGCGPPRHYYPEENTYYGPYFWTPPMSLAW